MLLIAFMLAGQQAVAPPSAAKADVVIIGNRMRDALEKCLARNCPPEEEVDAAMDAGAESFAAGRYREARTILRRAVSRNKKYGGRMPGRMSDLYATYADVTEHEGDEQAFRRATHDSVIVLRRALGSDHPTVLGVNARVGDMWVKLGNAVSADSAYRGAAEDADRAGHADLAAALTFRRAWLATGARDAALARRLHAQLERDYGSDPRFAGPLRVLKARIAMAKGDEVDVDKLVAALGDVGTAEPLLVREPPYPEFAPGMSSGIGPNGELDLAAARSSGMSVNQGLLWADIGYWVRPDGKPAEVEILRPMKGGSWAKPLVKHIAARRYAPMKQMAGGIGAYRIERFTLRSAYGVPIGSRIMGRIGPQKLQVIDLTRLAQRNGTPPP